MFQERKIYLVPTKEARDCLYKNKGTNKLNYHRGYLTQDYLNNSLNSESFHLHIIDDKKINDLDSIDVKIPLLFISSNKTIKLVTYSNLRVKTPGEYYHILVTTDESLQLVNVQGINSIISMKSLPHPLISFIIKYIEEYNKGNIITDIMVEYERMKYPDIHGIEFDLLVHPLFNTVNINFIKTSWNKSEFETSLRLAINEAIDWHGQGNPNYELLTDNLVEKLLNK